VHAAGAKKKLKSRGVIVRTFTQNSLLIAAYHPTKHCHKYHIITEIMPENYTWFDPRLTVFIIWGTFILLFICIPFKRYIQRFFHRLGLPCCQYVVEDENNNNNIVGRGLNNENG
jgi:hypothetical protein